MQSKGGKHHPQEPRFVHHSFCYFLGLSCGNFCKLEVLESQTD